MKVRLMKAAGAGVLSLGLVFGLAGLAGATTGTIGTTGPDSDNEIREEVDVELEFENDNDIDVELKTKQRASSGDAEVDGNTTGGDAETGDAENASMVDGEIVIDNSSAASAYADAAAPSGGNEATIDTTGPDSENEIKFESKVEVEVENDNDVNIENKVYQSARSGEAEVEHNTTGGSAVTGSASNSSSTSFSVRVTN